ALAVAARLRERYGVDVQALHSDDGILLRLPEMDEPPTADAVLLDPAEVDAVVQAEVGGSALFAARFRECAARALLLPRRDPKKRTPLWQQRQRSAQLLSVAARFAEFPVVLETMRECLQDVFDVPGLIALMRDVDGRALRLVEVETPMPSPFARSLLFGYVAQFLYEGDAPLAEQRAQALALDSSLLAELLGQAELRELLDPDAVTEIEAEVALLAPDRHATDVEGVADLLRRLGDLSTAEALSRGATPAWLAELEDSRRAVRIRVAGEERWIAVEDSGRYLDALGAPLPVGVPDVFREPVADPLGDLVGRYARTHGPFVPADVATRFGLGTAVVAAVLQRLAASGRLVSGELRPGGSGLEWCDSDVLRRMRRRSLARLRQEVEPVPPEVLGRFLPRWQGVGPAGGRGVDAVLRVVEQLAGAAVPASALESLVLPARIHGYEPGLLDELTSSGEVLWAGVGALPGRDGWVTAVPVDAALLLLPELDPHAVATPLHRQVLESLADGSALFFRALSDRVGSLDDTALAAALWDLVWSGHLTNDTLAPLRSHLGAGRGTTHRARPAAPRPRQRGRYGSGLGRPAMPARSGPPDVSGRWSMLPAREASPTKRALAASEALLDRYGVVTRGSVVAERVAGGFAAVYPVLKAAEESGRARRGYFVEGLGAAQFALPGAVDRLRAHAPTPTLVLAATDPANP
ncbi:MAG: Lhr family helicase, partial [Mycobacteriales bacterium]